MQSRRFAFLMQLVCITKDGVSNAHTLAFKIQSDFFKDFKDIFLCSLKRETARVSLVYTRVKTQWQRFSFVREWSLQMESTRIQTQVDRTCGMHGKHHMTRSTESQKNFLESSTVPFLTHVESTMSITPAAFGQIQALRRASPILPVF